MKVDLTIIIAHSDGDYCVSISVGSSCGGANAEQVECAAVNVSDCAGISGIKDGFQHHPFEFFDGVYSWSLCPSICLCSCIVHSDGSKCPLFVPEDLKSVPVVGVQL